MTEITRNAYWLPIDVSSIQEQVAEMGANKRWRIESGNPTKGKHIAIPVNEGDIYMIKGTDTPECFYGFLTDSYSPPYLHQNLTPYVSGYDRIKIADSAVIVIIPQGCSFLALNTQSWDGTTISYEVYRQSINTVTDVWDGEIDADGVYIDDAYYLENVQITGNDSEELLSLLAQIINIKSQLRLFNYEFSTPSVEYEEILFSSIINGIKITKCYKCLLCPIDMRVLKADNKPCEKPTISLYISGLPRISILNSLALTGFETLLVFTPIDDLNEGVLVALPTAYNTLFSNGYRLCNYIEGPGKSIIITDLTPTNTSKFEATIQLVTRAYDPLYPRLISAGRYNQNNGLSSSIEDHAVGGFLHVSYGNQATWSNYTDIKGDLNIHTYKFDNNSFYMDETLVGTGQTGSFTAESYFSIFGTANNRTDAEEPAGRIYHASFYQDDVLVADMYPAISSENVAGLYDIVRNKFFTPSNAAYTAYI